MVNPNLSDVLPIHVTGGSYGSAGGYAIFPTFDLTQKHYVVTFGNEAIKEADYAMAGHLAHELGHNLGLYHTYNSCLPTTDQDFLSDVFCVNPCPQNGGWNVDPTLPTNTATNNMMGGCQDAKYLSPLQIAACHRSLNLKSIRKYTKLLPYDGLPVSITQNELWDFDSKFYNTFVVESGTTLTIKCKIYFSAANKIIVKPGGKLIIDGGLITSHVPTSSWIGIEVWGNSSLPQTALNQGTLQMINNSVISNANEAVSVWKPNFWSTTGGILQLGNSSFINCRRSISYLPYSFFNSNGAEAANIGRITNCNFIWNNNFNTGFTNSQAITLYRVNGVIISGCTFDEQRILSVPTDRHSGIYALDSKTSILGTNLDINALIHSEFSEVNYDVSLFKNLYRGIEVGNSSTQASVRIDHCKFLDNYFGAKLVQSDQSTITRNRFTQENLFAIGAASPLIQLTFDKCTGYKVEGNQFNSNNNVSKTYGCYIVNSGVQPNEVFKNSYTGLRIGNYGLLQNQSSILNVSTNGLVFKCNTYNNSKGTDEMSFVQTQADQTQGIRLRQGTLNIPVGNVFTTIPSGNPNNVVHVNSNDFDNMLFYISAAPNRNPTANVGFVGSSVISPTDECPTTFTQFLPGLNATPQVLSGVQKTTMTNEFNLNKAQYTAKTEVLSTLVANGSSQTLLTQATGISNSNKQTVRNAIDAKSPYISETILRELGTKANGLVPPGWYKDLIIANIEVAKNDAFFNWLQKKSNPLPNEHIQQIGVARASVITQLTIKSDELTELSAKIATIATTMIKNSVADSAELNWLEFNTWVANRGDVLCRTQLVDAYLGRKMVPECMNKLTELDNQAVLEQNPVLKLEMQHYSIFKRYLLSITSNTGQVETLSDMQINQLTYYRDNFIGIATSQASNILCFHANICQEIFQPNATKSMTVQDPIFEDAIGENKPTLPSIKLIPNPSNGSFSIILLAKSFEFHEIKIYDFTGKIVEFTTSKVNETDQQIKVQSPQKGAYVIVVTLNDGSVISEKIIID